MKTIWKDVPGYEEYYQVSNTGLVRSKDRIDSLGRLKKGTELSQYKGTYKSVNLSVDGKKKTVRTHVIVAKAFLSHTSCGFDLVIDHIDNDRYNNSVDNLRLITHRSNVSRSAAGKSNLVGAIWCKRRNTWYSRIRNGENREYLGSFKTDVDAHNAYMKRLKEIQQNEANY